MGKLRAEQIYRSDVVQHEPNGAFYLIMDPVYDMQNRVTGFHALPIQKASKDSLPNENHYRIQSSRLVDEMGLFARKDGYDVSYNFVLIGTNVVKKGQLHDTRKETKIINGYDRAIRNSEMDEASDPSLPIRQRDRLHEYLPPQEETAVRPYNRKSDEEKAAALKERKTPKSVTLDIPLCKAFRDGLLQADTSTHWILTGHALSIAEGNYSDITTSQPLVSKKDKLALLGADSKPVVLATLKDAYNFVSMDKFVSFAAEYIYLAGEATARDMKQEVIEAYRTLNEHKFK